MNKIRIAGEISEVEFSHTYKGMEFYKTFISANRESGNTDTIKVILPQKFKDISDKVCIVGEIRTRNVHENGESYLDIFVYAKEIETYTNNENMVIGDGYICKKPIHRITPLLRCISDVLIACNRTNGNSDYIPSIAWGHNADRVAECGVGTHLKFVGRLQSRNYVKRIDEGEVFEKTAYELSMSKVEEMEDNENE